MFVYTPQNVCLLLLRIFGHKLPSLICLSTSDINKILQSHNKSILTLNFFLTNQLILTLRAKAFAQYPVSGQLVVSMKVQQLQAALSREIPFLIPTTTTPYTKSKSPTPRDELESLITPPLLKAASGCLLAATAALI